MNTYIKVTGIISSLLFVLITGIGHAEQTVYGWELMTEQERVQHREKMRSLQTEQEREAYRKEHHVIMQQRARERGIELPDVPRPMMQGRPVGEKGMGGGRNK